MYQYWRMFNRLGKLSRYNIITDVIGRRWSHQLWYWRLSTVITTQHNVLAEWHHNWRHRQAVVSPAVVLQTVHCITTQHHTMHSVHVHSFHQSLLLRAITQDGFNKEFFNTMLTKTKTQVSKAENSIWNTRPRFTSLKPTTRPSVIYIFHWYK